MVYCITCYHGFTLLEAAPNGEQDSLIMVTWQINLYGPLPLSQYFILDINYITYYIILDNVCLFDYNI